MNQWLLAVTSGSAAKQSAKGLDVTDLGPVHCHFSPPPSLFYLNDVFHLCDRKGKQTNLALYTDVSICCALKQKVANDLALTSRFKRHKKRLPKSTLCAPSLVPRPFRSAREVSGDETIVHLSLTCMPDASLPTPCRRAGTIAYTNLCLE